MTREEALKQEPSGDMISRQAVLEPYKTLDDNDTICIWLLRKNIEQTPSIIPQQKIGHCKDCKWWKDSDGHYRRGIRAESQCPMNREEVYMGNGYCFMYEPQEGSDKE